MTTTVVDVPGRRWYEIRPDTVRGALAHVRTLGLPMLPIGPFVRSRIPRRRDNTDLDYRRPPSKATD